MAERPTVLCLLGSFQQGGSEQQALQLARWLLESGRCDVQIACLDGSGVLRPEAERIHAAPIPQFPLTSFYDRNTIVQLRRFVVLLRERRIDVIHTHDFYTNVFGMPAAAIAGVPARVASRRESAKRPALHRSVERLAYRMAHAVVANCETVRGQLIQEGVPGSKITTVYNGLDMTRVRCHDRFRREEALAQFGLPAEGRRFVTIVANLREVKDHFTFLRAARQVHAEEPAAGFLLAGEGELEAPLRAYAAKLGVAEAVFFLGRCQGVHDLLAVSEVCALSSQSEGFSNAILEYMAAGRPVVVTDVGGAREAVLEGLTGYVVPAGDDAAMAARILELLRDPGRAAVMGATGRQRVEAQFSCEAQLGNTLALYERLLAASRAGRRPASQWLGRGAP